MVFGKFEKWQGVLDNFTKSMLSVKNSTMSFFKDLYSFQNIDFSKINFKNPIFKQNKDNSNSNSNSNSSLFSPNQDLMSSLNNNAKKSFFSSNRSFNINYFTSYKFNLF